MMKPRHEGLWQAAVLAVLVVPCGLVGSSCSTAGTPSDGGPPVCEFCDPGTQELKCEIAVYLGGALDGYIGESAYLCLEPDTSDEAKEQACLESCEQFIAGNMLGLKCKFKPGVDPFYWTGCVPPSEPTGGSAGADYECPEWYAPLLRVSGYQEDGTVATVSIERGFVDDLRAEFAALYLCDQARYAEQKGGWVFTEVEPGSLLHTLGLRSGDRNAVIQGFDPGTDMVTTPKFPLDSVQHIHEAYEQVVHEGGVHVIVERPQIESPWEVWVSIE